MIDLLNGNREIIAAFVSTVMLYLGVVIRKKLRESETQDARSIAAFVVILCVASLLLLALRGYNYQPGPRNFNWVPFSTFSGGPQSRKDDLEILANIGIFVPTAAFSLVILKRHIVVSLLLVVLALGIELAQYVQHQGRSAEIDDVILNVFGVGLGLVVHHLWLREPEAVSHRN